MDEDLDGVIEDVDYCRKCGLEFGIDYLYPGVGAWENQSLCADCLQEVELEWADDYLMSP